MESKKKETLKYWEDRARNVEDSRTVTHGDLTQRTLEIERIIPYLDKNDRILDVGCGNGYSTSRFSGHCREIIGIDFSSEMVKRARSKYSSDGEISYKTVDVRQLKMNRTFSKIISIRCLINILCWEDQQKALQNIAAHLSPNGYYLMMEGYADGRAELNNMREKLGLSGLTPVIYNLDFVRKRTENFLQQFFEIENFITFGTYEFITRILYPMYVAPAEPKYGSRFHEIALTFCQHFPDSFPEISKLGYWILKKK